MLNTLLLYAAALGFPVLAARHDAGESRAAPDDSPRHDLLRNQALERARRALDGSDLPLML